MRQTKHDKPMICSFCDLQLDGVALQARIFEKCNKVKGYISEQLPEQPSVVERLYKIWRELIRELGK